VKTQLLTVAALLACFSAVSVTRPANLAVAASDWPQWRGPGRDGLSREGGLLEQWPKGGAEAALAGERHRRRLLDAGSRRGAHLPDEHRGMENEFVQALSTADGKPVWTTRGGKVGNPNQNPPYAKARSTPTVAGDFATRSARTATSPASKPREAGSAGRRTCAQSSAGSRASGPTPTGICTSTTRTGISSSPRRRRKAFASGAAARRRTSRGISRRASWRRWRSPTR
jgi:hypothetical protein